MEVFVFFVALALIGVGINRAANMNARQIALKDFDAEDKEWKKHQPLWD